MRRAYLRSTAATRTARSILLIVSIAAIASVAGWLVGSYKAGEATHTDAVTPIPIAQPARDPHVIRYELGAPQRNALRVAYVESVPLPSAAPMNGRVAYDESVTARVSSPILGRVVKLRAELGDSMHRGDALVVIDSPDLAASEADLAKALADQDVKRLALARSTKLFDGEVIARKELETAEAELRQANAEARRARLKMRNLNSSGGDDGLFLLRSPIDGVVADKQVNPGLEVRPDLLNPLFTISDTRRLWALVDVPEQSLAAIHPGQSVDIETDAWPGEHFAAKVERIGAALDPSTRRIQVRCAIENLGGRLRPEMFVRVSFIDDRHREVVRLSNSSLVLDGVEHFVFVERQPGEFEKRRVHVVLGGADNSYVDEGVKRGEVVVTEGALLLNAETASDAR